MIRIMIPGMKVRTRCFAVFLFYGFLALSASAMTDADNLTPGYLKILQQADFAKEPNLLAARTVDGLWQDLIYEKAKIDSASPFLHWHRVGLIRIFSYICRKAAAKIHKTMILMDYNLILQKNTKIGEEYLLKFKNNNMNLGDPLLRDISDIKRLNSAVSYFYEKEKNSGWGMEASRTESTNQINLKEISPLTGKSSNISDLYRKPSALRSIDRIVQLESLSNQGNEHGIKVLHYSDEHPLFLDQFCLSETAFREPARTAMSTVLASEDLKSLFTEIKSASPTAASRSNYTYAENVTSLGLNGKNKNQDYAIVVGINGYDDGRKLHNSVNDARSIAEVLGALGYKVILLSDNADKKPIKHNILDMALKEMTLKNSKGNIVFYFSGHGIKDINNTFYLIPQDANGDKSSYISEYELKQYMGDLENLAIILDVCNGGGLRESIAKGQVMIASSRDNEPSNEEWIGNLSVFTQSLINAIKDERKRSNKILLQDCYYRAYEETVRWSRGHLLSQTPVLVDLTDGKYYLK